MRRGFLVTLGVIIILGFVIFVWWLPAFREAEIRNQISAIEAMENLTARKDAALSFLLENQLADREILLRALDAAADEFRDAEDKEPLIALYEGLYDQELTSWLRYRIISRLDRVLMEMDTEESVAKAEELAKEMLKVTDAPLEPYSWIVYFHSQSEFANPELTLKVALAAEKAIDMDETDYWPMMLDMSFGAVLNSVAEEQGVAAAVSRAGLLEAQTESQPALSSLYASVFGLTVDEDEEEAIKAAAKMAQLTDVGSSEPSNRIAYDMAERGLAPDVAVKLSMLALEHASSRFDSTMVLDTVGWAHYAAGDYEVAASHLKAAIDLMDETLTFENGMVQHLLTAYDTGGMTGEAIDLLSLVVARSVMEDDPARTQLSELLVARDGTDDAMEAMVVERRYEGLSQAPDFVLKNRDGELVDLEDLKGDILLVCFWSYG